MPATQRRPNVKTRYLRPGKLKSDNLDECPKGVWEEITRSKRWRQWTHVDQVTGDSDTSEQIYKVRHVERIGILEEKREQWIVVTEDEVPQVVVSHGNRGKVFGSAGSSRHRTSSPVVSDDAETQTSHDSSSLETSDKSSSSEASEESSSSDASEKSFISLPSDFRSVFPHHDPKRTKIRLRDRSIWKVHQGILRDSKLPHPWRNWNQHLEEWGPGSELQPGKRSLWKWAKPLMNPAYYRYRSHVYRSYAQAQAAQAQAAQAQAAQAQAANNVPPRSFPNVGSARVFTGPAHPEPESTTTYSDTRSSETGSRTQSPETHSSGTHSSETQSSTQFSHQPGHNSALWTEDRHQRYITAISDEAGKLQNQLSATGHNFIEFLDVLGVANSFGNWGLRERLPTAPVYEYDPSLPRNVRGLAKKILRQAAKAVGWDGRGLYLPFERKRLEWMFRERRMGPILKLYINKPRGEWEGAVLVRAEPAFYWLIKQDCLEEEFQENDKDVEVIRERRVLMNEIDKYMHLWAVQNGEKRVQREMRRNIDACSKGLGIKYTDDMWEMLYRVYKHRRNIR
ncbi:MAG: hypothetical protein Q9162_001554 [Coniocarpon cinnabarinum]